MTKITKARADETTTATLGGRRRKATGMPVSQNEAPPAEPASTQPKGKITMLVAQLRRREGATIETMMNATGWQAHSVRGAISGAIKKGLGLVVTSNKTDGVRRYRITPEADA